MNISEMKHFSHFSVEQVSYAYLKTTYNTNNCYYLVTLVKQNHK